MKKLLPLLLLICSCATQKKLTTGAYTIASRHGNVLTFKEVPGRYEIPNDTLKVNDVIVINVIKRHQ